MISIFKGFEFNVVRGIACYCERNHVPSEIYSSIVSGYNANDNRLLYECYINNKGNLVLSKNEFRIYLDDKTYNQLYEENSKQAVYCLDYNNNTEFLPGFNNVRVDNLPYSAIKERINNKRPQYTNNIKSIYIKNQKIIITPKRTVYFVNGKKIRRVSKKELNWHSGSFITDCIANPEMSTFFKYNEITGDALRTQSYHHISNMYGGDIYHIKEHDLMQYYTYIGNYFPLVNYLRYNARGHSINVLSDDLSLPTYVKKKLIAPESKSYYDYGINNESVLKAYKICKYLKLKDLNIINKFINFYKECFTGYGRDTAYSCKNICLYYKYLKMYYTGKVKNLELLLFNRLYFDIKSKNSFKNTDALRMLTKAIRIRNRYPDKKFKKLDMEYLIKHSLSDIHDTLSIISRDDTLIENYKEFDMSNRGLFEKTVNNYKFLMPENSSELTRLADIMRNCVASYQANILNGSSIIVYGTDNMEVLDYIKNGNGDLQDLSKRLENNEILSPACIEINLRKIPSIRTVDYVSLYDSNKIPNIIDEDNYELILRQCYGRHNRHVDELNPNLEVACQNYFMNIGISRVENRYWF